MSWSGRATPGRKDSNDYPIKVVDPPPEAIREIHRGANTDLVFTLTVTGRGGSDGDGISTGTDTAAVTVTTTGGGTNLLLDFGTASDSYPIKVFESRDTLHRFVLTLRTARDAPADGNPQQPVTIPLLVTHMGGATTADYEGLPASVTFGVGESEAAFDMHAFQDQMTETGEGLRIDFGALPPGIVKGDWGPYETVEFVDGLVPIRATVDGATLVLTYDKVLSTASSPRASDFTVRVAAQVVTVDAVSVGGSPLVTLTLATAVQAGQTVTVDYRQGYDRIYDLEGNQAVSFDDWVVTNTTGGGGGGPVTDTRPPLLTRATVNGGTLVLTYDETLDGASVPAPGAFAVTAAGSTVSANGVSVAGSAVTLTLANAVQANQTVTLDYTPGANPIQDAAGNDAAPLSGQAVTNNTPGGPVTDTRPPLLTRATVNGDTLVLTYDETLDGASVPAPGAFAVTAAGSTVSANGVSVAGSAVTLTLANAVQANQTVTLDYTPGANPIQDAAGNDAAPLSGQAVTNNTPGGPVTDTRPPLLTRATVNGDTLVLTYDETLDGASVPAPGAFAVTAAGSTVSANGVSVAGSAVTVTLANAVQANQTVTLDYTPGANPI